MAVVNGDRPLKQRPIGELVKQLAEDTGTLLRKEVELAKAEMGQKLDAAKEELTANVKNAGIGAGMFAGAAAFALVGLGVLAALLARVLDSIMPSWVALTLVLLLYLGIAAALAIKGRDRLRAAAPVVPTTSPVPEQTIETLKEDVEWVKHPTKSGAR